MLRSSYPTLSISALRKGKKSKQGFEIILGNQTQNLPHGWPALTDCATSLLSLIMASPSFLAYYINKVGKATSSYLKDVKECDIEQHYTRDIADFNSMHDAW